jgi:hypothetical protein
LLDILDRLDMADAHDGAAHTAQCTELMVDPKPIMEITLCPLCYNETGHCATDARNCGNVRGRDRDGGEEGRSSQECFVPGTDSGEYEWRSGEEWRGVKECM